MVCFSYLPFLHRDLIKNSIYSDYNSNFDYYFLNSISACENDLFK